MGTPAVAEKLVSFGRSLSEAERDQLKFAFSKVAVESLDGTFDYPAEPARRTALDKSLNLLRLIQPYSDRLPGDGAAYFGRPAFMTDEILDALSRESVAMRPLASRLFDQMIVRVDNPTDTALCERFASSEDLFGLVTEHAGACSRSFVTSYIYYDVAGDCSQPHVDNAFTALTAMVSLKTPPGFRPPRSSATRLYFPGGKAVDYHLEPGQILLFPGCCILHGRTPVSEGEAVSSLLTSFRPA